MADITAPDLQAVSGTYIGQLLVVYQVPADAEWNRYAIYSFDDAVATPPGSATDRFIAKAENGYWISTAGTNTVAKSGTFGDFVNVNNDGLATGDLTVKDSAGANALHVDADQSGKTTINYTVLNKKVVLGLIYPYCCPGYFCRFRWSNN